MDKNKSTKKKQATPTKKNTKLPTVSTNNNNVPMPTCTAVMHLINFTNGMYSYIRNLYLLLQKKTKKRKQPTAKPQKFRCAAVSSKVYIKLLLSISSLYSSLL